METEPDDPALQRQIDELSRRLASSEADIEALGDRVDHAQERADLSESRSVVDREMIAELQADGVLGREYAAQMQAALRSSRTIGAAIGMLMASRDVSEDQAFAILVKASQRSNRKLRDLAAELVAAPSLIDRDGS